MFAFGMAATLFMAGMELEFERIRGRPLWLAVGGWGMSVALGLSAAAVLHASRLHDPMIVALALATTSLGTLLPILRDADQLDTPFGRLFIAAGTMGELGPIVAMSLLLSQQYTTLQEFGFLMAFLLVVILAAAISLGLRPPRVLALVGRSMHASSCIKSAEEHGLLEVKGSALYKQLDELRRLRNRIHIQNKNKDFANEQNAFNWNRNS